MRRRRIVASGFFPAFYRGRNRTKENRELANHYLRLRQIWIEGRFAVLKREHKLVRVQKRGLIKVKEECLLACLANNLKKMAQIVAERPSIKHRFHQFYANSFDGSDRSRKTFNKAPFSSILCQFIL